MKKSNINCITVAILFISGIFIQTSLPAQNSAAVTDVNESYEFVNMMQGNYMVRCVQTTSVSYPAQGFSTSFPSNPLNISGRLVDAGDENTGGANAVNFINKSFSSIAFEDQTWDFGYADVFVILANNNYNLKGIFSDNNVALTWQITNTGKTYYALERSIDGLTYKPIFSGTVNNNVTSATSNFLDINLPVNTKYLYYRLRITDNNQKVQYTDAIIVKTSNKILDQPVVFPNPAKNTSTLLTPNSLINKAIKIIITTTNGQVIRHINIANAAVTETINLKGIKEGVYIWYITTENKKTNYAGKLEVL